MEYRDSIVYTPDPLFCMYGITITYNKCKKADYLDYVMNGKKATYTAD